MSALPHLALSLAPLLLLSACVRVTQLGADSSGPDDSAGPGDSDAPVESVCVPDTTTGYATPDGRWALAALYGARRLEDIPDSALRLGPEWFLASAWQASAFGCGDFGPPWSPSEATEDEGCLQIQEGTHWVELCRIFPELFPCEDREARISGAQVLGGVVALTWHAHLAHALQQRHEVDPDAWLEAAGDARAVERLAALLHAEGAWSWQAEGVFADCAEDIAACLEGAARRHVDGVSEKLGRLEDAGCYDAPLTEAELEAFLDELAPIFPDEDWESARAAALAELDGRGFAEAGPAVLNTLDATLEARLVCPERELWDSFQLSCP
ncbi:MAG: hypothetical protein H6741_07590 [Alphaproteobacteria bacterium]|nr:hypothetical protein [Alphaproteobacteria bacterium]MCB9792578.1 hypothetical protein [Alphaproteobacteria bacterium]